MAFSYCKMVVTIVMVWDFAERFKILGKMIASIPELKESGTQFVFVPAMSDVGSLSVYPRPPLQSSVTATFSKQVKKDNDLQKSS